MRRLSLCLYSLPLITILALFPGCKGDETASSTLPQNPTILKAQTWDAWKSGEIDQAAELAAKLIEFEDEASEGRHLLFYSDFVKGDYKKALNHYKNIDPAYAKYGELDNTVVDVYLHLGRYAEAEQFAQARVMKQGFCKRLRSVKERALKVALDKLIVIPFAGVEKSEYFPDFEVEINRQGVIAHMDTGGTFLIMPPDRAKELGIELTRSAEAFHAPPEAEVYYSIAKSFKLGKALLENVFVVGLLYLVAEGNYIIFGTNVLQEFLSTFDYPNKRLILSPRNNSQLRKEHLPMLPEDLVNIPFYMWGDHYMYARGALGEYKSLNFFIDSGLVRIFPDGKGGSRQAAFMAPKNKLAEWGYKSEDIEKGVFESHLPLFLGSLKQDGLLFVTGGFWMWLFEGMRIDGLLSHAFLKKYTWTIDFSNRKYIFSSQPKE